MRKAFILVLGIPLLGGCFVREYRTRTPAVNPVTREDVMAMSAAGYPDSAILERIGREGVLRAPGADDIITMKNAGVSNAVLDGMLRAPVTVPQPARESRTVVVEDCSEPVIFAGMTALAGYLMFRNCRPSVHVHYRGCIH